MQTAYVGSLVTILILHVNYAIEIECPELNFHKNEILGNHGSVFKGNHVTPWKAVFLSLKTK